MRREIEIIAIIAFIGIAFGLGWLIPSFIPEEQCPDCLDCPDCPYCPDCPEELEPLLDQIKARGKLIVGTAADYPPFENFTWPYTGEIEGFDVDLSQMIADELGVNLTMTHMNFDSLIAACNANTIDMVAAAMTYTSFRAEVLAPSITYMTFSQVVIVRNDSVLIIESLDNLTSYTVGVQSGTIMQQELEDLGMTVGVDLIIYPSADSLIVGLDVGAIDAAYVDEPIFTVYNEIYDLKIIFGTPTDHLALWCKYGEPELLYVINKVISEAYQNGTIYNLIETWFG